jgi:hypothetical protein
MQAQIFMARSAPTAHEVSQETAFSDWDFRLAKDNFRDPDFTGPGLSPPSATNEDFTVAR